METGFHVQKHFSAAFDDFSSQGCIEPTKTKAIEDNLLIQELEPYLEEQKNVLMQDRKVPTSPVDPYFCVSGKCENS